MHFKKQNNNVMLCYDLIYLNYRHKHRLFRQLKSKRILVLFSSLKGLIINFQTLNIMAYPKIEAHMQQRKIQKSNLFFSRQIIVAPKLQKTFILARIKKKEV